MAVHMIRVVAAATSPDTGGMSLSEINTAMDDWVSSNSEWEADPTTHEIVESFTDEDGTEFYVGNYRFLLDDAKDNLLQKAGDKLKTKLDWYRLGYHLCEHDSDNPGPCTWEDSREWTSKNTAEIPADVPDFV